jgi:DNA-binding CsgD family transcriptional regulator
VVEAAFRSFGEGKLTRREQTVVSLVLRGHSTSSIAKVLGIGEGTVKSHRKAIMPSSASPARHSSSVLS